MRTEYVVVLNYEIGDVSIFPYDSKEFKDVEEYFKRLEDETGYEKINLDNCHYMVTSELKIDII